MTGPVPPAGRGRIGPRPVDAASLILVDRSRKVPRVLMGRRHMGHVFMPGAFVFPGGRLEAQDRAVPVYGALDRDSARRLKARTVRASESRGRALALAAIRETFEETGLMLGTREAGAPPDGLPGTWGAFAEAGVFPDIEALAFVARAVTPPGFPRRFDTRFFLADAGSVAHRVEGAAGPQGEFTELAWMTVPEARRAELPPITLRILDEVEPRLPRGAGLFRPVPYLYTRGGGLRRDILD